MADKTLCTVIDFLLVIGVYEKIRHSVKMAALKAVKQLVLFIEQIFGISVYALLTFVFYKSFLISKIWRFDVKTYL